MKLIEVILDATAAQSSVDERPIVVDGECAPFGKGGYAQ
jgi:hypothetical protein